MKIALFYPKNMFASWYALGGYRSTLTRMGHDVLDCPLPGNEVSNVEQVRETLPTIDVLNSCDCVFLTFAEYVVPWLSAVYGLDNWSKLKVAIVARFDESFDRDDLKHRMIWGELNKWAQHFSFPAAQDADLYGGRWEPFGADETVFHPGLPNKLYGLGFIGSVYPKRIEYMRALAPHIRDIPFHCAPVVVQDLSGAPATGYARLQTDLLADNYRKIKVFFCLPPMSNLIVAKVFEVMAAGTFIMYPRLAGDARKNLLLFQHEKHLVYYTPGDYMGNAEAIRYWLSHDKERDAITSQGGALVRRQYTLSAMLERILEPVMSCRPARLPQRATSQAAGGRADGWRN